ncbi:MAG TPA: GNAT family N-acetyltransferase, partial [Pirellulales bacterium]|nr:GNAT family N-acetyltransferase [Pirellulales bacterium]
MSNLIVVPVTSRRQQKQFVNFPWKLYEGDPNWVPPLLSEHVRLLGYRHHPFYDDAQGQTFLALRDGVVCGRIMALVNHAHNRRMNEKRGFFGFFECIDDPAVSGALFDAARAWLAAHGMQSMRGPCNPSLNYELGLLIEGFDSPPTFMMTYNKPYYAALFEHWGLRKTQDMYAFWGHVDMIAKLDKKLSFIANEARERFKVKVRPMKKHQFREELAMFLDVYNQSLIGTWGFVPLSPGELKALGEGMRHLIVPELALAAEVNGETIGCVFGLLDYNPRIKKINGRLFPFGFIRLLFNRRAITKMRVISINVIPEYQRWGLGVVLLGALIEPMLKWGMKEAEFSWVLESNTLSRGSLEKGGAKLDKSYRVYDYDMATVGNT